MNDDRETYEDQVATMAASGASRQELIGLTRQHSEAVFDIESLKSQQHNWVDRGLKMSCEGAGHPMHQSWKHHSKGNRM